jgi:hypothetical protein
MMFTRMRFARPGPIDGCATGCCKGCFYLIAAFFIVNTLLFFVSLLFD